MNCRSLVWTALLACALLATGCATREPNARAKADSAARELRQQLMPTPLLLVGEQHDAAEHQAVQAALVRQLSAERALAALVIEMAEAGDSTVGLPPNADEATVQRALRWDANRQVWPWMAYGPAIMAAVGAGVPVLGGNLPAADMRAAMRDAALDGALSPVALREQQAQIREGHCGLLPDSQIAPMTRIQIARDQSLARTAVSVLQPGKTVLLLAGNQHVRRDLGVPLHLGSQVKARVVVMQSGDNSVTAGAHTDTSADRPATDRVWQTAPVPVQDHCAEFKARMDR